jgi:hypothetical protein
MSSIPEEKLGLHNSLIANAADDNTKNGRMILMFSYLVVVPAIYYIFSVSYFNID